MTESNLFCPECGHRVTKAGGAWSGRSQYQQFRCPSPICRRATIRPLDGNNKQIEKIPYNKPVVVKSHGKVKIKEVKKSG